MGGGSRGGGRHNRNPSGTLPSILGSPFVTADSSHLTLMRLQTYAICQKSCGIPPTREYTEVITHPGKVFCTGLLRPTKRAGPVTLTTSLSERSFLSDSDSVIVYTLKFPCTSSQIWQHRFTCYLKLLITAVLKGSLTGKTYWPYYSDAGIRYI